MSDTPRWQGYSHEEIVAMVSTGPGGAAGQYAEGRWHATWFSLSLIDAQLSKAIADIGSGWEGQGATATSAAVTPLGAWAMQGAEQALSTSKSLQSQAGYADHTRNSMPEVPYPGLAQNPSDASVADVLNGWHAKDKVSDEKAALAQELMQSYTYNSFDTLPGMLESVPPPTVAIGTASIGGGGAGGGVGALPATSGAELGSGSPTASAAAGPGAAGGSGGIAAALGPTGAAGSGTGGAGAAGPAGGGAGAIGPGGIGAGSPGAVGAGAGSAGGGGLGGRVGGVGPGAGGAAPGLPGTAGGLGRGVTPSAPRTKGLDVGRPGASGLGEQNRSGNRWPVPASPPRGPSASWSPIGSNPGSDRLGSGGSAGRAGDALPPPGRVDRGSTFPSSAPPAGSGGRAPAGGGHAPMMPMGGGAGGGQNQGHRRASYLIDDGSAFADDRWIPSHIVNENPEDHRG